MRILAACGACRSQFDVSGYPVNAKLRCRCGGEIRVPSPREQDARVVRCASCGASRSSGTHCDFCGAQFSTVDRGWGTVCPSCYCRLPNDARFCVECGIQLSPQRLDEARADQPCPRCNVPLRARTLETIPLMECGACAGMWLSVAAFSSICQDKETLSAAGRGLDGMPRALRFELTEAEKVQYIPCPVCRNLMNRRNFAGISGVIIDTCKSCGVWLDNQELNHIVQFLKSGGMDKARELEERARAHAEKMRPKSKSILVDTDLRASDDGWTILKERTTKGDIIVDVISLVASAFFKS